MNKLYFRYGAMGSSKSATALICKYNYEEKGYGVLLLKANIDTRDTENGKIVVKSRIGLVSDCIIFNDDSNIIDIYNQEVTKRRIDVILVDEINFAKAHHVDELRELTKFVPVLLFGLKADFKTLLFEGSKRALELSDDIQEIKTICRCGRKATQNMRIVNGEPTNTGPTILVGGSDAYESVCWGCYRKLVLKKK